MGKKGQGRPKGSPGKTSSPEERSRIGEEFLANRRFKEAIEIYKSLLAGEDRPEWKDGLAAAYAGHAQNLAAKGMVEEALVVWQNRSRFCGKPLMEGPWFEWILRRKNGDRELVEQISRMGPFSESDPEIARNLSWPLFFLSDDLFSTLKSQDPLIGVCRLAREAWHHYEKSDRERAEETAGKIPFRSPYAAVRLLLRALLRLPEAPEEAREILSRVPSTPLDPVVEAARIFLEPRHRQFSRLAASSGEATKRLTLALLGHSPAEADFICELLRPEARSSSELFRIVERHRSLLDPRLYSKVVDRLLPHLERAPSAIFRILRDQPDWVKERAQAQYHQIANKMDLAEYGWETAARLLSKAEGARAAKEVAAIYRHLARGLRPPGKERPLPLDDSAVRWLKKSREFDPYHRETLVRLAESALAAKNEKEAKELTKEAMTAHPEDPEILRLRIRALLLAKESSEIVRTADRLLQVDPQSPGSRRFVLRGWQVGFYDSLKKERFDKARALLARAREIADPSFSLPERAREILLDLREGRCQKGDPTGVQIVRDFVEGPQFALLGSLVLDLELRQVGSHLGEVFRQIGLKGAPANASPSDIWRLVELRPTLAFFYDRPAIVQALSLLGTIIKKMTSDLKFSPDQDFRTVEFFCDYDNLETAKSLVASALKRHKEDPGLTLLKVQIDHLRSGKPLSDRQIDTLSRASDRARRRGALDMAARIEAWLDHHLEIDEEEIEEEVPLPLLEGLPKKMDREELDRFLDTMVEDFTNLLPLPSLETHDPPPPGLINIMERVIEESKSEILQGRYTTIFAAMKEVFGEREFQKRRNEFGRDLYSFALNGLVMFTAIVRQVRKFEEGFGKGKGKRG